MHTMQFRRSESNRSIQSYLLLTIMCLHCFKITFYHKFPTMCNTSVSVTLKKVVHGPVHNHSVPVFDRYYDYRGFKGPGTCLDYWMSVKTLLFVLCDRLVILSSGYYLSVRLVLSFVT